jgi:hypothetical protein
MRAATKKLDGARVLSLSLRYEKNEKTLQFRVNKKKRDTNVDFFDKLSTEPSNVEMMIEQSNPLFKTLEGLKIVEAECFPLNGKEIVFLSIKDPQYPNKARFVEIMGTEVSETTFDRLLKFRQEKELGGDSIYDFLFSVAPKNKKLQC